MRRVPPFGPFGAIQDALWPDEWLSLVACMMLNCTSRKQVERVLPRFRSRWPTPQALLRADRSDIVVLCRPLGFSERRTTNILKMSERYIAGPWQHAGELPGIGEYGRRSWEMFFQGLTGVEPPNDHVLRDHHEWRRHHEQRAEDRSKDRNQTGTFPSGEAAQNRPEEAP